MKAYILSDDREHGVKLANIINAAKHTAVLSEYASKSYEDMIDEAEERVNSGYDFAVVVTRSPLDASIHANKNSKLRAVVCRTPADAAKARAAKANLVILDANDFTKTSASSIMHGWLGSAPEIIEEERDATTAGGKGISIGGIGKSIFGAFTGSEETEAEPEKPQKASMERQPKSKAKRQSAKEDEEEEPERPRPKGGGILKRLKYEFGLE